MFAKKTAAIKDFKDLTGKTVAVTRGAMEDQELNKVAPSGVDYRRFEDNNATVADPRYLDLVARGLLWSCGKLDAQGNPLPGYGPKK